ncbi:hypothetical protein SKAU_G00068840 [Synaphobranchus kaupii]|uniref:Uncharacterized protein n=1 Tax=Synaphobranchus kaupii TaxID=118154 RepID=A0A9Q1J9B5_SYNKA|nr:hypothetical protein SKAU_G00068840 [Synaphobranchus kaupii]
MLIHRWGLSEDHSFLAPQPTHMCPHVHAPPAGHMTAAHAHIPLTGHRTATAVEPCCTQSPAAPCSLHSQTNRLVGLSHVTLTAAQTRPQPALKPGAALRHAGGLGAGLGFIAVIKRGASLSRGPSNTGPFTCAAGQLHASRRLC